MLKIDYKFDDGDLPGWGTFTISNGSKTHRSATSYVLDSYGNFAKAAYKIIKGSEKESLFDTCSEPLIERWYFFRENDKVKIKISDDILENKDYQVPLTTNYYIECSIDEFKNAVLECLDNVLNRYGLQGYQTKWSSDGEIRYHFPMAEFLDLKSVTK